MKVLAALDITEESGRVLDKAAHLARQQGAELILYNMSENFTAYGETLDTAGLGEKLLEAARTRLDEAGAQARVMGLETRVVAESGASPAEGIVDYASANGVDLIVVGHRSKTGLERFLLGSVAAKVVTHAPCSVFVVR